MKKETGWWLVSPEQGVQGWAPATHLESQVTHPEDQVVKYPRGMGQYPGAWDSTQGHGSVSQGMGQYPRGMGQYPGAWVSIQEHGHGQYPWPSSEKFLVVKFYTGIADRNPDFKSGFTLLHPQLGVNIQKGEKQQKHRRRKNLN